MHTFVGLNLEIVLVNHVGIMQRERFHTTRPRRPSVWEGLSRRLLPVSAREDAACGMDLCFYCLIFADLLSQPRLDPEREVELSCCCERIGVRAVYYYYYYCCCGHTFRIRRDTRFFTQHLALLPLHQHLHCGHRNGVIVHNRAWLPEDPNAS